MSNTPPPKNRMPSQPGIQQDEPQARQIVNIPLGRPSAGVPSVIIEDPTPVNMPLSAMLERRAKLTQKSMESVDTTVTTMKAEISELKTNYKELDAKVDGLAVTSAEMKGMLGILVKNVDRQSDLVVHHQKVTITREATQERVTLEDNADERKFKRQKWLKIIGVIAAIGTALAGGITILFTKCG